MEWVGLGLVVSLFLRYFVFPTRWGKKIMPFLWIILFGPLLILEPVGTLLFLAMAWAAWHLFLKGTGKR